MVSAFLYAIKSNWIKSFVESELYYVQRLHNLDKTLIICQQPDIQRSIHENPITQSVAMHQKGMAIMENIVVSTTHFPANSSPHLY